VQAVWEGIVFGERPRAQQETAETAAADEAMELKRWKKARRVGSSRRRSKIDKKKKI